MLYKNIKKISLNYQIYNKFLSFKIKKINFLEIKGFFGVVSLVIPDFIRIKLNKDKYILYIFFDDTKNPKYVNRVIKQLYNTIIFSSYGVLFCHLISINIKGIGYKFEFDGNNSITVFSGKTLPYLFEVPKGLRVLEKGNLNNFSLGGGNYSRLISFAFKLQSVGKPNKYKEIGIYLNKK